MRKTLRVLLNGILTWLFLKTFTAGTLKTSNSCLTTDEDVLQLTCNPGEMIHITSFLYQTASEDCNTVDRDCQVWQQSSDDSMLQSCNGKQTCGQTISNERLKKWCNTTSAVHVKLSYGCISESPVDVCRKTSQTLNQQLYLISPDYLTKAEIFSSISCECAIYGSDLTVEILELNLPFLSEDRANITLIGDSGSWSSSPLLNFLQYNKLVFNQTENVTLLYDARGKTKQNMWLRLQGSADITVICNGNKQETYSTVSLNPSTPHTSVSVIVTPTIPKRASQDNNEAVIVGVLACVLAVMVIIAVLLLVYLYRIRKQGDGEPGDTVIYVNTQNPNDNMNETVASAYAELNTGNTLATHQYEDLRQSQTSDDQHEDNESLEPVASSAQREDEIHRREISLGIKIVDGTSTGNIDGSLPFLEGDLKTRNDCERENVDVFNTSIYENKYQFGITGAAETEQSITDGNLIYSNDHTRDQFNEYESPITQGGNYNAKHKCHRTNVAGDYIEMKYIPDRAIQVIDSSPLNDCQQEDNKYLELADEQEDYFV